ncbi:hypothetical protein ABIE78_004125 [Sinorhizobium fredii]|uniref:Cytochrome c-type biogenesis protein DsbD, protein-disulfide reductase n=1 Tax=Sinorhizobium fredii (strain USDA 257) TaxID=1185652 RepID=I3X2H6_SINF2|nr:DUF6064 family protein [Sinorhizobium fredii]AFL50082.1 hypothetical protein USDA257_c14920 [Sinorhizobium fredii USDA 257]
MSEWATYTLSDLLMFSPRVYFRLIERYNQDFWPLQLVFVAGAFLVLVSAATRVPRARVAIFPLLAAAWLFCAWQFLWLRYAAIHWGMSYAAAAFLLQAGLMALQPGAAGQAGPPVSRLRHRGGIGVMLFGLLVYPCLALLAGRSLASAETFVMMPDPTATTTLGTVLAISSKRSWLLLPIPLVWCAFSGLTLLALEDAGAWAPFAAIIATLVLLLAGRR